MNGPDDGARCVLEPLGPRGLIELHSRGARAHSEREGREEISSALLKGASEQEEPRDPGRNQRAPRPQTRVRR